VIKLNKKIVIGVIGVLIAIICILIVVNSFSTNNNIDLFQNDIVGQGNPSVSWSEQDTGIKVEKFATVFQWFESKGGNEYKNVKIRIDLYKNDKIIDSKDTIISSLKDPQNIFVTIDVPEEPDHATTTVINATLVK